MKDDMNGPNDNALWEAVLRGRRLSTSEEEALEARLARTPGMPERLEDELALNQALERLPDAPVSSNFTAQVLLAVQREQRRRETRPARPWWSEIFSLRWGRRLAFAGLVLGATFLVMQQQRQSAREELARQFQGLEGVPSIEALQDFEAIRRLGGEAGSVDEELLNSLAVRSYE
jgi:anti-sigma factor RsiW